MTGQTSEADRVTPEDRYRALVDTPPSVKLVYKVLERESPLTRAEICERSTLPARTTNYALTQLQDADIVRDRAVVTDARRRKYDLRPVERPD